MKKAHKAATPSLLLPALLLASACVPYEGKSELDPAGEPRFGGGGPFPGSSPNGGVGGSFAPPGRRTAWMSGAPVSLDRAPPPISGGTLLLLGDGNTAFAADPDRDQLYLADLVGERLLGTITLAPGDEPGRAVEDGAGNVVVLLRGAGALVRVSVATRAVTDRMPICSAPRGIDRDPARGQLVVACGGGELITLAADSLAEVGRLTLDRDLRDVVVDNGKRWISRFRSAELVVLDSEGKVIQRGQAPGSPAANAPPGRLPRRGPPPPTPPMIDPSVTRAAEPAVAWRLRPRPGGGVMMLHQEASNEELGVEAGGYAGGGCRGPSGTAVAEFFTNGGSRSSGQLATVVLPTDFALSPDGRRMAVVSAGSDSFAGNGGGPVVLYNNPPLPNGGEGCTFPPGNGNGSSGTEEPIEFRAPVGQPTSVAFDGRGRLVAQTRDPARLEILTHRGGTILLSPESRFDTGHAIFHMATGAGAACASCHPDGTEDGHVWRFAGLGPRRSQSLRGGLLSTAPFHWNGEMKDLSQLMRDVFSGRMAGPPLNTEEVTVLGKWLDRLPAMPALTPAGDDPVGAAERGRLLFHDASVGCTVCHSGPKLTNNQSVFVGTGTSLQVPSLLGVGWRAPFMHNGCARTLVDRFDPACGGDRHGNTSGLTQDQKKDLAAFLETL